MAAPKGNTYRKKHTYNEEFFKEPNVINSYWAGFIAADGCISDTGHSINLKVSLKSTDIEILEKLAKDIEYSGPIPVYSATYSPAQQEKYGYTSTSFYSAKLVIYAFGKAARDLKDNFNITPRKSLTLKFPGHLPDECKRAFIVGYSDGDGCISFRKDRSGRPNGLVWYIVGTQQFLQEIQTFMGFGTIYKRGNCSAYRASARQHMLELPELLQIDKVPHLPRKWDKIEEYRRMVAA